jgi:hypothetical protein
MLTEAIHSLVDTGDQVLLLIGQRRGAKPPDATHPLGYGMEVYFWSFVVALMVFLLGGALSLYEGARQISNIGTVISPWISLAVLAVAATFGGTSLRVAYREFFPRAIGRPAIFVLPSGNMSAMRTATTVTMKAKAHHRPSFLEYGEYPYVSADEIKKALKMKDAFSNMLGPSVVRTAPQKVVRNLGDSPSWVCFDAKLPREERRSPPGKFNR